MSIGSEGADQEIAVKIAASELFSKFKDNKTEKLSTNEFFSLIDEASEETRSGCTVLRKRVETLKKKRNIRPDRDLELTESEFYSLFVNDLRDWDLYDLVWDMIDDNKTGYIQFEELKAAKAKYGLMLLDDKDLMQMVENLKSQASNSVHKDELFQTLYGTGNQGGK